jgi:rhodanese-related sulfurtransferase
MLLGIPSPDLVINLFASTGQVLGLLSVVAGGAAVGLRLGRVPGKTAGGSRVLTCTAFLLFICTAACALLYHTSVQDATNRRLRANLVRTSSEEGRDVGDASLKTLSYSGQQKHPAGITTEDLSAELAAGKPLNMIDVREAEEAERGRVLGSWHRRYPDLFHDRSGLVQEGMKTVLLCYSGNRSSELVDAFRVDGISTLTVRFGEALSIQWKCTNSAFNVDGGRRPRPTTTTSVFASFANSKGQTIRPITRLTVP